MTTQDAKNYLAKREIPQLFESLMTGLMYYRPEDHITYLQECLRKIKENGLENVKWNLFIESRKKTPLPPIGGGDNGRSQTPLGRDPSFITERHQSLEEKRGSPLPPIGQTWQQDSANNPDRIKLPECPLVLILGGPGSGRATQSKQLVEKFEGWVHISMGDLLRQEIFDKGSADDKWDMIGSLVSNGQLAPEEMPIDMVKAALAKHMSAKGIILEGYPRTMAQVQDYEKYIGRVDLAFMLDCEEYYLQQRLLARGKQTGRVDDNINAVAARISFFKDKTLPAVKHFDDMGKLVIIEGDRDSDEIFYDLCMLFHNVFFSPKVPTDPKPPTAPRPRSTRYSRPGTKAGRPGSGFTKVALTIGVTTPDNGRVAGLPSCPIIFIMGGPGSGKGAQCKRVTARYSGFLHLSVGDMIRQQIMQKGSVDDKWKMIQELVTDGNMAPQEVALDLVKAAIQEAKNAKGIIIEGYPRVKEQVEDFNRQIGGLCQVVLIDCEETTLSNALKTRAATSGRLDDTPSAIPKRISYFKYNSLPILAHFDDKSKLSIVNGDGRTEEQIFGDITAILDKCVQSAGGQAPMAAMATSSATDVTATAGTTETTTAQFAPPIKVMKADTGRISGLPSVPIITIIGAPGSASDKYAKELAQKLSIPHITAKSAAELVSTLQSNGSASAIIVDGFPSNKAQVEDFNSCVGGLNGVIVLDCDESYAKANASSSTNEVEVYKSETLPALGYFDEGMKLSVLNIQECSDVIQSLCSMANKVINKEEKKRRSTQNADLAPPIQISLRDGGRQSGLPTMPIIAVIGGPSSGVDSYCKAAAEKLSALHLQNHNVEGLVSSLKSNTDKKCILVEGLPKCKQEVEDFNKQVGGMTGVVVLDTTDEFCKTKGASEEALKEYKANTLPVLLHYEDCGQLQMIPGEEDETSEKLCQAIGKLLEKQ